MALQSMLAKLEGEEDIPPPPAIPAPPIPANQNISRPNSSPFHEDVAPLGMYSFTHLKRSANSYLFCSD